MLNYYCYRLGQFIALKLPLKLAYRLAVFLSDLHYWFFCNDRRCVNNNLSFILPEKTAKERRRIAKQVFRNFAKYLVDFFRFEKIDREFIKKNIKLENLHYFDQALKLGKGVVVLTAHLGNWELGGVVIAQLGYPFWVVALPHKEKKVNDFFNGQRASKGVNVISTGKAIRGCIKGFRDNHMIAFAGDKDFAAKGIILDFFNKPTLFPEGPAAFSFMTGAVIVPGFMLRNPDDSFTLRIEKPIEFTPTQDKKKDIVDLITIYKNIFQDYIRKYPDQWYAFREFWIKE
ncbi:MAG: lysophospholipid acyltransferase family protein [Candidatus Omnitrophica bacterium]|nr:lysophospholipid acyltransferase family protein [Candidatus Omnitrophota bacterium]